MRLNSDYTIYIIKQDIRIYMLFIAGQTAGPIGLKFFVDTHEWPGGVIFFCFQNLFSNLFSTDNAGPGLYNTCLNLAKPL